VPGSGCVFGTVPDVTITCEPDAPAGPVGPCVPVAPVGPVNPIDPCDPCAPVGPCDPYGQPSVQLYLWLLDISPV
jgi:hypothetical protein